MKALFTSGNCLSRQEVKNYLQDRLSNESRFRIENHLLDCPMCNTAVGGYAQTYNFNVDRHLENLEEALSIPAIPANEHKIVKLWQLAAAVLIFLIPTAVFLYWNNSQNDRLFASYFESFESNMVTRGEQSPARYPPLLQGAMDSYQKKSYAQSIPQFYAFLETDPENTAAQFMLALASIELQEHNEAINLLEIVRLNDEKYFEDATWYLILAHLKMNSIEDAKVLLSDLLQQKQGFYYQKARDLLFELSK